MQSVCTRCRVTSTRHWFQLMSLVTLGVAATCNSLAACLVLPRLAAGHQHRFAVSHEGFAIRGLLIFAFAPGLVPLFPNWIRPPAAVLVTTAKLPHLPVLTAVSGFTWLLPWGMVGLAAALLCINAQTRDSLLGHGRVLSAVSLVVLVMVLMLTLLAFPA